MVSELLPYRGFWICLGLGSGVRSDLRAAAWFKGDLIRRVMCRGELWSVDRWGSSALAD